MEGSEIWCPALAVAPRTSALPPAIALPTSPHCSTSRIRPEHPGGPEASIANKESSAPSSCPVALCLHPATSWTSGTSFSTPRGWISSQRCPAEPPGSPLPGAFAPAPASGPALSAGPAWTGAGSSGPGGRRRQLRQLPVAAAAAAPGAAAAAPGAAVPPHGLAGPAPAHPHPPDS